MITATLAEKILQLLRELIQGSWALREEGKFTPDVVGSTCVLLTNAVHLLDSYLTQVQAQQTNNLGCILRFLAQSQSAICLLSDQRTQLILRWPTPEDSRVVYPHTQDESTQSIDIRRRWMRIDNANSKAVEFPVEETVTKRAHNGRT